MYVVDTNVLVYAANRDSEFHERCRQAIEQCRARASPWYVSWPICYEFLRVCVLVHTNRHMELLSEVVAELPELRANILHDAHTAVLMREHGIRQIYTRDSDFHRFPFITVIDPTR